MSDTKGKRKHWEEYQNGRGKEMQRSLPFLKLAMDCVKPSYPIITSMRGKGLFVRCHFRNECIEPTNVQ